jgi:outer membrane receptor protein involved in Fe transport
LFVNHSDGVDDDRRTPVTRVNAVTTLDLTARFKASSNFEIGLDALNILNAKPEAIYISNLFDTPFDTTNYSPVGRFVAAHVSWKW